jgi:hypothetical protein
MSQTKAQLLDNIKDNVQLDARNSLRFADTDSSHYVAFKAPATVSSNVTWTLPAADGSANYVLATDGSGTLSWIADPAGQWTTSGSNIYFTGGNVGIGDSSPSNPLSVTGASVFDGDLTLTGSSYNVVWDKSDNALEFADNAKAVFGAGSDLEVYHSGSNSVIKNSTGYLQLATDSFTVNNNANDENIITALANGEVRLYFDNGEKLNTVTDGVNITGSLQFGDDTNTYLQRSAADTLQIVTGGTAALTVDASQEVGIGTTGPATILDVRDTSTTAYPFTSADSGVYSYTPYAHELNLRNNTTGTDDGFAGIHFHAGERSAGGRQGTARISALYTGEYKADLVFATRNTSFKERMRLTAAGRVGLGIASPTGKLSVHNSDDSNLNTIEAFNDNGNISSSLSQTSTGDGVIGVHQDGGTIGILLRSNGVSYLNGGNVGIGTTSPLRKLHVEDSNSELALFKSTKATGSYINFKLGANGAELGMIGSGAEILSGGADSGDFGIRAAGDLCISSGGHAEKMRIDSSGRLLIGHTATTDVGGIEAALQVTGTTSDNSSLTLSRFSVDDWCSFLTFSKSRNGTIGNQTACTSNERLGQIFWVGSDGTDTANGCAEIVAKADGNFSSNNCPTKLEFGVNAGGTSSTTYLTIKPSGNVEINDGNLVVAAGHGIDFSDQTASSATGVTVGTDGEVLDHYEEGSWTPKARGHTTAGTYSASNTVGRYTRIGDVVTLTVYVSYTLTGAGGYWEIYDLPFASRVGNYACGAVFIKRMNINDTVKNNVLYIGSGASLLSMYGTVDDAVWVRQEVDDTSGSNEQGIIGSITYKTDT